MKLPDNLPQGTYCSDPEATHTVSGMSDKYGSGIYGYYTNEFDAHRVRNWYLKNGASCAIVEPYDPMAPVTPGMHPLVEASLKGYS